MLKRRRKWLLCLGLQNLSTKELLSKFVCHKHFERRFVKASSRLQMIAYPTLFTQVEIDTGIPSHAYDNINKGSVKIDHDYERLRPGMNHVDHTYNATQESLNDPEELEIPKCPFEVPEYPVHSFGKINEPHCKDENVENENPEELEIPKCPLEVPEYPVHSLGKINEPHCKDENVENENQENNTKTELKKDHVPDYFEYDDVTYLENHDVPYLENDEIVTETRYDNDETIFKTGNENDEIQTVDEIDALFLSYAHTFKKLSSKLQTMLKLDMAKLFSRYEMKEDLLTMHESRKRPAIKLKEPLQLPPKKTKTVIELDPPTKHTYSKVNKPVSKSVELTEQRRVGNNSFTSAKINESEFKKYTIYDEPLHILPDNPEDNLKAVAGDVTSNLDYIANPEDNLEAVTTLVTSNSDDIASAPGPCLKYPSGDLFNSIRQYSKSTFHCTTEPISGDITS